jgi:protocatechuate 3,4-dioxygenase beta subunit
MPVALLAGLLLQTVVTVAVTGRVVSSTIGAPIRKAAVTLQSGAVERVAITDAEGRFRFSDVAIGKYVVKAERAGFVKDENEYEIEVQENPTDFDLKLDPQAILAGRVLDEDGDPMPGAGVRFSRYRTTKRGRSIETGGNDADADGHFVIGGLSPGYYLLSAKPPENVPTGAHETYVETYYSDSIEKEGAADFKLSAGTEIRNIEIRLRKSRSFQVRGRLVLFGGEKVARVELLLTPDPMSPHPGSDTHSASARDERFTFAGVRPGAYILSTGLNYSQDASTGDYRAASRSCYYPITVDTDLDDLVVNLGPGVDVTGHVKSEGDNKHIGLQMIPRLPRAIGYVPVKKDGTFAVSRWPADYYHLMIMPPKGEYVSSIQFNGEEVKERTLNLTAGVGGTLEIELARLAAEVTATVKGEAGASVVLWSKDASVSVATLTDDRGQATIGNLAPGEYRIAAFEDPEESPDSDESFKKWETSATKLNVAKGEHIKVELTPIDTDSRE